MRDTRYFTQRKMTEGSHPIRKPIILLLNCHETCQLFDEEINDYEK